MEANILGLSYLIQYTLKTDLHMKSNKKVVQCSHIHLNSNGIKINISGEHMDHSSSEGKYHI